MSNKSSLLKGLNSLWGVIINHAHSSTPTHTQPKKGHNHPHPPTPSKKRSHSLMPTHTQPKKDHTQPKKVTLIHTHPHPAKKGDAHPHLPTCSQKKVILTYTSCKSMEKKIIDKLIKFIRNSRSLKNNFCKVQCQAIGISISTQYQTNDKQVSCCHKQF